MKCAISIRHATGELKLFWRVRRSPKGEIFQVFAAGQDRDDIGGKAYDPHTSVHADGTVHSKAYDDVVGEKKEEPLKTFTGPAFVMRTPVDQMKSLRLPTCVPAQFDVVFEIPAEAIDVTPGRQALCIDLAGPDGEPPDHALGEHVVYRWILDDAKPGIVVTLYEAP